MRMTDAASITPVALAFVMAMLAASTALGCWIVLPKRLPPPMAVVDLTDTLRRHQQALATRIAGAKTDEERRLHVQQATSYGPALERAIAALRRECGCTLVLREAIVAGDMPDLTPRLAALIDHQ